MNPYVIVELRNYARGGAYAVNIDMAGLLHWCPDLVFIWIGSNDLDMVSQGPHSEHAMKIRGIWNSCQAEGINAFTVGVPNRYRCRYISPELYNTRSDRVNQWLKRRSADRHLNLPVSCYQRPPPEFLLQTGC